MRYTITFSEGHHCSLAEHLFRSSPVEEAAYLLCGITQTDDECRLLVREVIPIPPEDILEQSDVSMSIKPVSYVRAIKQARLTKAAFVFVHSHPNGSLRFSRQDDAEEKKLFALAHDRASLSPAHLSLIFTGPHEFVGRIWLADGSNCELDLIRIIGRRFSFLFNHNDGVDIPIIFDRQVQAFGPDIQRTLSRLRVGVVGVGGTGSSVLEQLSRLGVGSIIISDDDGFDPTNINRLYGSRLTDDGMPKVEIAYRHVQEIGLDTQITVINQPITYEAAAKAFRNCDVIFCCTDDQWGRSILNSLFVYYTIPIIDMGVRIDSSGGVIYSVQGRVTILIPGSACLLCRGRITPNGIADESRALLDPGLAEQWRRDGYAPEITETRAPAVIPFTTAVASSAISELLHRLTGFMGQERTSTEVLHLFDESRVRTNNNPPREGCLCNNAYYHGRGDRMPFLDIMWAR